MQFQYSIVALVLLSVFPSRILAQEDNANPLIQIARDSSERFKDVSVAQAEGYALQLRRVSGEDAGAMRLHYVNRVAASAGVLDATHPQAVTYEAMPGVGLRLIRVDYLLLADAWNARHSDPPELMGQPFHLVPSPNRFGLPAFYTLRLWAWNDGRKRQVRELARQRFAHVNTCDRRVVSGVLARRPRLCR